VATPREGGNVAMCGWCRSYAWTRRSLVDKDGGCHCVIVGRGTGVTRCIFSGTEGDGPNGWMDPDDDRCGGVMIPPLEPNTCGSWQKYGLRQFVHVDREFGCESFCEQIILKKI